MEIDPSWHKDQIKRFKEEYENFKKYAEVLSLILNKACKTYAPNAVVLTRVKTSSSFAEKIIRKSKYTDPLKQITDLCGARVLVHTLEEVDQVCNFIRKNFSIDEKNSINVKSRLNVDEFGYLAIHFIVTPEKKNILKIKIPEIIRNKKAEIQVRTMLQHTWSEIFHDRIYKSCINVPENLKREFFWSAAILESVDKTFNELSRNLDVFLNNYAAFLTTKKLSEEIDTLRAILEIEPEEDNKPQIALKLAKALKFREEWVEIIKILLPYKELNGPLHDQIILEYGNALCQNYFTKQDKIEFQHGIDILKRQLKSHFEYNKSAKNTEEFKSLQAIACSYMGEAYSRIGDFENSHNCFLNAFELDVNNPYFLVSYLELELQIHKDRKILGPMAHAIKYGIEKCKEHISVGIELLKAYWTLGKFWLLLDEPYKSLDAYAKAIDLCISGTAFNSATTFEYELNSLKRLAPYDYKPKEFLWIELLLKIAISLNSSNKSYLEDFGINKDGFSQPVLIIAGDADMMNSEKSPKYKQSLAEGLLNYCGTIVSGGTKSGIPGLVGEVKSHLTKSGNKKIKLIAYIPMKLSKKNQEDIFNYDTLYITDGQEFSPLEPLYNWIDIINNGIEPKDIKVLGFGGGPIADFEYKLALCLGAKVGLIESSGRAVSELINDINWTNHQNLLILPDDMMTLKAFIHVKHSERLSEKQVLKAAQQVHKRYCKSRKNEVIDERTEPWQKLRETYKNSNLNQVKYIEAVLNSIDYGIREANKGIIKLPEFTSDEIEKMAEMEHGRWNAEKLSSGWRYGKERDNIKKLNPFIVPWSELKQNVRQFDRDAVLEFPKILKDAGFETYKIKK